MAVLQPLGADLGKLTDGLQRVEGPGRLRYIMALLSRGSLQFHSFDQDYLQRLASGDAIIEHHFSSYFGDLLSLKLRVRIRSPQLIEDIRQETLLRVLRIVRKKGIEHPERFGAFVSGVCGNVMMELLRGEMRHAGLAREFEPADDRVDLDVVLVNQQRR